MKDRHPIENDMGQIDIPSISDCFPTSTTPPVRLIQLIKWLSQTVYTDLLTPDFCGELLGDFWIENGSYLAHHFGLFLHQADGTRVGYWLHDGCEIDAAPTVILGSGSGQDEVKVIANSIEDLVSRILVGQTGVWELDDLWRLYQAERESSTDSSVATNDREERLPMSHWFTTLENWVEREWNLTKEARQQLLSKTPKDDHPSLEAWLERWSDEQQAAQAANSICREIFGILRKYLPDVENYIASIAPTPEGQEAMRSGLTPEGYFPWFSANFDVFVVGSKFEIWKRDRRKVSIPEGQRLKPLLRQLRTDRARQLPEQGLWFSASLKVSPKGTVLLRRSDEYSPPEFSGEQPTATDYEQDLSAFPCSPRYTPPWLQKILS
ncbi:MAG: hypothetical protein ACFB14_23650 [Leptolyngbyaceae cyanobacterium]